MNPKTNTTQFTPRRKEGDIILLPDNRQFTLDSAKGPVVNLNNAEAISIPDILQKLQLPADGRRSWPKGTKVVITVVDPRPVSLRASTSDKAAEDAVQYRLEIVEELDQHLIADTAAGYSIGPQIKKEKPKEGYHTFPHRFLTDVKGQPPSETVYKEGVLVFLIKDLQEIKSPNDSFKKGTPCLIHSATAVSNRGRATTNPTGANYELSKAIPAKLVVYWKSCDYMSEELVRDQVTSRDDK